MASRFSFVSSRPLASLVAGCLATVLIVGCNDPELEKQAAFERQFNEVAAEYAKTLGGRPDLLSVAPTEESITALRSVAEKAKGLSGGSSGQQTAARTFASSVYRTVASIELSRAASLEASHEVVRNLAMSASSLASDLDAVADAAEGMDLASSRGSTESAKSASGQSGRRLQEEVQRLEGPASQLAAEAGRGTARLSELGQEVAVLLRKARESSPSAGLAFVEEASSIKTEARGVAKMAATKQAEADAMKGDARVASAQLKGAQGVQSAASAALELINGFEADIDGGAAKCRDMARELRKTAESLMKTVADERTGALKAAYEATANDLASASADAASDAMRNTILSEELRMQVTQITGIGAQARMLASAGGANAAGVSELKAAAEAAITALREKSAAAAGQFEGMGEDPAVAPMKTYVDGVKKMADGLTVDKLLAPPTVEAKASSKSSGRSMSSGAGAKGSEADLEAVIAKLNGATSPMESSKLMIELVDDSSGAARAMKDIVAKGVKMMEPLMAAVEEKFGAEGAKALGSGMGGGMGGMGGGMAGGMGLSGLTKKSFDGSKAVYTDASGQEVNFVFTSSGWKLDLLAAMPPAQAAMMEQAGPMIDMVMKPMSDAMKALAGRVRAGEFNSAEEVAAAIQQQMMEAMTGGMGGGGGGGFGGMRRGGGAGREGEE
ncbi:MAG: hypothetical protein RL325_115 [Planctomycetota bacterium]